MMARTAITASGNTRLSFLAAQVLTRSNQFSHSLNSSMYRLLPITRHTLELGDHVITFTVAKGES
jgi:hypothetical protein